MTWSWEIGLLVAISVLALVLALIAWRRRYIADLLEASLNATHQGRQVVDRAGAVKFANIAFRRLFGDEPLPLNVILERRAFDATARASIERIEHALGERRRGAWRRRHPQCRGQARDPGGVRQPADAVRRPYVLGRRGHHHPARDRGIHPLRPREVRRPDRERAGRLLLGRRIRPLPVRQLDAGALARPRCRGRGAASAPPARPGLSAAAGIHPGLLAVRRSVRAQRRSHADGAERAQAAGLCPPGRGQRAGRRPERQGRHPHPLDRP